MWVPEDGLSQRFCPCTNNTTRDLLPKSVRCTEGTLEVGLLRVGRVKEGKRRGLGTCFWVGRESFLSDVV